MSAEKRARELLAELARQFGHPEYAYHIGCGGVLDNGDKKLMAPILAALTPKWEPISTAPKDGAWIILGLSENWKLGVDGRSCPGYWLEGWEHGADYEGRESGWVDAYHNDVEPNCWLPLPAPPEGE